MCTEMIMNDFNKEFDKLGNFSIKIDNAIFKAQFDIENVKETLEGVSVYDNNDQEWKIVPREFIREFHDIVIDNATDIKLRG